MSHGPGGAAHPVGSPRMQRRTFLKGMGGVAAGVMLGGCRDADNRSTAPGRRPTVRVDGSFTYLGLPSPFAYVAGPGYWRMSLCFDTLMWPDSTGELLPWLASSHRASEDGLLHTLDLRDARWDDGRPVTARDVAFTYEYYTTQTFTPLLVGVPRTACEVVPQGERTVEFRLQKPDATFYRQVLGTMPIVPEHIWSTIEDPMSTRDERIYVSTGAYKITTHDEIQGHEAYDAKDGYLLGRPYVRRIEMRYPPNDDALTALRIGELDCAPSAYHGTTNALLDPFRDDPEYGMTSLDAGFAFPLYFNIARGGALADVRFRRACLHAIDRDDIVNRLLTGNGQRGSPGWLPPSHPYYEPAQRDYPFDRVEAERLLDEAGYRRSGSGFRTNRDGSQLRYTLSVPNLGPLALAELTAESLKAVGIDIDLQSLELVQLFGIKLQGRYDLALTLYPGPGGTAPVGDPDAMRAIYHSTPPNPFLKANGYSHPEVDRLLDQQLETVDVEERKQLVRRIQRQVAEDLPVAMLYYSKLYFVYRKAVFDQWYYTPGGFGTGIADVYNKHVYITGRKTGLEVQPAE